MGVISRVYLVVHPSSDMAVTPCQRTEGIPYIGVFRVRRNACLAWKPQRQHCCFATSSVQDGRAYPTVLFLGPSVFYNAGNGGSS